MKSLWLLVLLCAPARAGWNYVRPIDPDHIVKVAGVWIDPYDTGKTAAGTAVALLTHDPKDGCMLPDVVCEQWAPLTTGFSYNGGRFFWNVGPAANVFPWMMGSLRWVADKTGLSDADPGLHEALTPPDGEDAVTFSFGPQLNMNPISKGHFQPLNHWDSKLVLFTGAVLRWGKP